MIGSGGLTSVRIHDRMSSMFGAPSATVSATVSATSATVCLRGSAIGRAPMSSWVCGFEHGVLGPHEGMTR